MFTIQKFGQPEADSRMQRASPALSRTVDQRFSTRYPGFYTNPMFDPKRGILGQ